MNVERPLRIGISGSYGGANLGDEAILAAIVAQLRASLRVELTVFTRDPDDTRTRHGVEHAVAVRSLTRREAFEMIAPLDVFVLGGGGLLYDAEVEPYLREVALAHEAEVPVFVYAISAGPLTDPANRRLVLKHLSRAADVTVRDRSGHQLLEEIGLRSVHVTADPSLLLQPSPLPPDMLQREGLDGSQRLVGFSVREPGPAAPDMDVARYHALLANTADFMVDRLDADVVFVPMERRKLDVQHSHAVVAQMQCAQRATVLKGEFGAGELISLMNRFQFSVGMRLHFLIFSALQGVPFVALPYASKVAGFISDLGLEMPPLEEVTIGRLIAHIDRSWDMHQELRERIRRNLPRMQERARETHARLLRLIEQRRCRH